MVQHGIAKHNTRGDKLFFKAVLAGVMLSYGGLMSEIVGGGSAGLGVNNPGLVKLLAAAVFPVGLVMIVLQGHELLTSNMMIFTMACLKGAVPWWGLPWNWVIDSGIISTEPYISYAQTFAIHKAQEPAWYQIFLRGIGCNWMVCVAVWQASGAKDTLSKVVAIWIPITIFVTAAFDHVIANMYSIPLGILLGADMTVAEYIRKSLIASYLGNIVGALIVALPATYFYLGDYRASGLRGAEEGEVFNTAKEVVNDEDSTKGSNGKANEEAFEVSREK
ncbi:hypothetical protein EVJ58_g295 [Rhodofomes roseus]|uniref:Formate/nitrite transporter n=1 Tax=Rhodofomes roseus TaxID=34475 RepID=A0A4Y9Z4W1_9APHY|nr:hypothetical protein EVJ58_g295 [Rhodofomes roseus]